ncbi:MAG: hypothetical protein WB630_08750 [Candidatus Acidiferrales bacterium]
MFRCKVRRSQRTHPLHYQDELRIMERVSRYGPMNFELIVVRVAPETVDGTGEAFPEVSNVASASRIGDAPPSSRARVTGLMARVGSSACTHWGTSPTKERKWQVARLYHAIALEA